MRIAFLFSFGLALTYVGWVFWSRYDDNRRLESAASKRDDSYSRLPSSLTGTSLAIAQFYAVEPPKQQGDEITICYGVRNATNVLLDPPLEKLNLALNRCFPAVPQWEMPFKLIAEGEAGRHEEASFTIGIGAPPKPFRYLVTTRRRIERGDSVTVCYGINGGVAHLDPAEVNLSAGDTGCFRLTPQQTTIYTLSVRHDDRSTGHASFTVTVK